MIYFDRFASTIDAHDATWPYVRLSPPLRCPSSLHLQSQQRTVESIILYNKVRTEEVDVGMCDSRREETRVHSTLRGGGSARDRVERWLLDRSPEGINSDNLDLTTK